MSKALHTSLLEASLNSLKHEIWCWFALNRLASICFVWRGLCYIWIFFWNILLIRFYTKCQHQILMIKPLHSSLLEGYSNCFKDQVCYLFAPKLMLVAIEKCSWYIWVFLKYPFIWCDTKFIIKTYCVNHSSQVLLEAYLNCVEEETCYWFSPKWCL